jgi:hypothetical protein
MSVPPRANQVYGAPQAVYLNATFSRAGNSINMALELTWLNKVALALSNKNTNTHTHTHKKKKTEWETDVRRKS